MAGKLNLETAMITCSSAGNDVQIFLADDSNTVTIHTKDFIGDFEIKFEQVDRNVEETARRHDLYR